MSPPRAGSSPRPPPIGLPPIVSSSHSRASSRQRRCAAPEGRDRAGPASRLSPRRPRARCALGASGHVAFRIGRAGLGRWTGDGRAGVSVEPAAEVCPAVGDDVAVAARDAGWTHDTVEMPGQFGHTGTYWSPQSSRPRGEMMSRVRRRLGTCLSTDAARSMTHGELVGVDMGLDGRLIKEGSPSHFVGEAGTDGLPDPRCGLGGIE